MFSTASMLTYLNCLIWWKTVFCVPQIITYDIIPVTDESITDTDLCLFLYQSESVNIIKREMKQFQPNMTENNTLRFVYLNLKSKIFFCTFGTSHVGGLEFCLCIHDSLSQIWISLIIWAGFVEWLESKSTVLINTLYWSIDYLYVRGITHSKKTKNKTMVIVSAVSELNTKQQTDKASN